MTNEQLQMTSGEMRLTRHSSLVAWRATAIAFIALILIGCANAKSSTIAETIEYRGTKFGFRLAYPSQWQMLEDAPPLVGDSPTILHAVTFQPPQDSKSLVIAYIQTLTTTQTLDAYAAQQMIGLRANELGATFTELSATQLGGLEARSTSAADDKSQLRKMVMTINNSTAYALLLFGPANADLAAQFEAVLKSFSLLP
jgi:hypothetical protein